MLAVVDGVPCLGVGGAVGMLPTLVHFAKFKFKARRQCEVLATPTRWMDHHQQEGRLMDSHVDDHKKINFDAGSSE